MKISLNWLKNYIDIDLPALRLIETLDRIGLMVEAWEANEGDVILELDTYANRPDTTGHLGVARELAVALGLPLKKANWPLVEVDEETSNRVDIQIWDEDLCPRYCGIIVKGMEVGPSPEWLREKIESMGLKPVNNVVDVTNYVLFSTAHPIHAFDLEKIAGQKVIIRRANKEENLKTLEGENICLSSEELVIADEVKPIALAGVIGGEESAVTERTRDVFIESACFDPLCIRKTSKKTGIQTDASYRFERGADVSFPHQAALMAASLLTQVGGKATKGIIDVYPKPKKNKTVLLRHHRITELLGLEIQTDFITNTLSNLEFRVEVQQQGIWQIKVPHFRIDVEREADLIEEIARFYGYDKIPSCIPPFDATENTRDLKRKTLNKLRQLLFHYGFNEVMNFSFFDLEKETHFKTQLKPIEIRNPVSSRATLLRTTLFGGLLENIAYNKNRGAEGVHTFEIGNIYFWEEEKCVEKLSLAIITTGYIGRNHWRAKKQETDFFHLKGTCEALMAHLRYRPFAFQEDSPPGLEPEYSLSLLYKGEKIGYLGLMKKEILDVYSLKDAVWAAHLDLDELLEKQPLSFQYVPVVKYPSVSRDVAFIAGRSVRYQEIKEAVEKLAIPYLEQFDLYDRFSGSTVPRDKISLSLHLVFRHPKRTLLAEEVDNFQQKIIDSLNARFGFHLREGGKIDKRTGKN